MRFLDDAAVIALARPLIMKFEGYSSTPYLCPAGKWTIGYGTTKYPSGKAVGPNDYAQGIGNDFAGVCLVSAMVRTLASLAPIVTRQPTLHQAAALVCLAYNVGVGCHDGIKGDLADSTLIEKFNAGDVGGCADCFLDWDKAHVNGKLVALAGLTTRRAAERSLFLTADA